MPDDPPRRVLTVNAGSSSLKLAVLDEADHVVAARTVERWDGEDTSALTDLLADPALGGDGPAGPGPGGDGPAGPGPGGDGPGGPVAAVGHRVVHGGERLTGAVTLDGSVEAAILALAPLAPLHQQAALAGVRAARAVLPHAVHVACFDTAFHAGLPPAAATYAVPAEWRRRWPIRRYGFHGLSHAYAARRAAQLVGSRAEELRVVSCHLGSGASLCAVAGGRSVDTTMGFTPLEGVVMATRSGTVDPGLVLWLLREGGIGAAEVYEGLERRGGLAGLSGTAGDMRDVLAARERGDASAVVAFDVYVHRLRAAVAAMAAAMGGVDVLVFTGGVGEHSAEVRAATAAGLGFLGVGVDPAANAATTADGEITGGGSAVRTVVVTAREDVEIARLVRGALGGAPAAS